MGRTCSMHFGSTKNDTIIFVHTCIIAPPGPKSARRHSA
jgi:hypothetical protein